MALSKIFQEMLYDPGFIIIYFIIDILDQCITGLSRLLELIKILSTITNRAKWIISNRPRNDIERYFGSSNTIIKLSLKQNTKYISRTINIFIDYKLSRLIILIDNTSLLDEIRLKIYRNANGTFLWIILVIQEFEEVDPWNIEQVLDEMPIGLIPLYNQILKQINNRNMEYGYTILLTITIIYHSLHLLEL